ncbi:hypothetical protein [Xenorhabdus budapestensis]|uniref:Uncharacterized protein n=1 Tax=Xenorhabdus budapestensis TaxID=290110 RepID=A0A2D0IM59_XENBU|nr:hypothetical protein [Xenorhabdus budapestensis]PHM22912.1 hypothetical protein Xbud_03708 [Xenorhabdus budapestensis]
MLKKITFITAFLLTSMWAVADRSNGVGVDANGNHYVIDGGYECEAHKLKQGKEIEGWNGALIGIAGSTKVKAITLSLFKNGEESPEFAVNRLRIATSPSETFYTNLSNTASIRVNSKSIAIAIGTNEEGTGILLTNCIAGTP